MGIKNEDAISLIERILASRHFDNAKEQKKLLGFLFHNRGVALLARDIEEKLHGFGPHHANHNPGRTRTAVLELRDRLGAYAKESPREKWICGLPESTSGYQLQFRRAEQSGPVRFWETYLDTAEDVILVNGSHLFFFDPKQRKVLRLVDFNLDGRKEHIKEELKRQYPDIETTGFEPWHNVYLASGDVRAYELLLKWFHDKVGILLKRVNSRDIKDSEIIRATPILIGRNATNTLIADHMNSRECSHLSFRFNESGQVQIRDVTDEDRQALASFSLSPDGAISVPVETGPAFGIFTRIKNPTGYGHITMISCDYYAMVIARIVESLLNDRQAGEMLQKIDWPLSEELPDSFEMLFSVDLSPGRREGEGLPKLLCWRLHESPVS